MNPGAAHEVIGALEPNGKGVILAYCGRSGMFGKMHRRSTYSERFAQPIDVYDVLMCCTETMELKTLRLYFNAYFPADKPFAVRLPQGFHLDASNRAARLYNCVV